MPVFTETCSDESLQTFINFSFAQRKSGVFFITKLVSSKESAILDVCFPTDNEINKILNGQETIKGCNMSLTVFVALA